MPERVDVITLARQVAGELRTVGAIARSDRQVAIGLNSAAPGTGASGFLLDELEAVKRHGAPAVFDLLAGTGTGVTLSWSAVRQVEPLPGEDLAELAERVAKQALEAERSARARPEPR